MRDAMIGNDSDTANNGQVRRHNSMFRRRTAAAADGGSTPSSPGMRSFADTDGASTLVSSPVGSGSFMNLDDEDEKPKKKRSFFGLRSRRNSKNTLLSPSSSQSDRRSSASQASPRFVEISNTSPTAPPLLQAAPVRTRATSSPKTPSRRGLSNAPSYSSLMSTDSIGTIATLSPHGRSSLRHVSTPETRNPPIDPDFSFEKFIESREPIVAEQDDTTPPSVETPIKPPKRKNLVAMLGEDGAEKFQCSFSMADLKSPGLPSADLADTDPEQWAKAVELVRKAVQKEKALEEAQQEAPPEDRQSLEFGEFERRLNARLSLRIEREEGYAAKLIDWCQRNGFDFCSDLPTNIERKELWEAIKRWEDKNSEADPEMESVRQRFFNKIRLGNRKKSTPQLRSTPRLPLTPCLSSASLASKVPAATNNAEKDLDTASKASTDAPLESSPDEEHYLPTGLGITTGSSSASEGRVQTPEQYEAFHDSSTHSISPPGANDPWNTKHPISLGYSTYGTPTSDCVTSPIAESISRPAYAPSFHESDWESVTDEVDHSANDSVGSSASDPERPLSYHDELEDQIEAYTPSTCHAKSERFSTLSTLNVRRDSTRARLTPKRNDSFHKGQWQQQIQEASAKRAQKLGMVNSPVIGHPALRDSPVTEHPALRHSPVVSRPALKLDTDVHPRRLASLPPQLEGFDMPTPTRKTSAAPNGSATLLKKLQLARSPSGLASKIPRPSPPKYGQHISPGKALDEGNSPVQASGTSNLNKATPLPVPSRPARTFSAPLPATIKANEEAVQSPVDEHFEDVLSTWQAVTPQIPPQSPTTPNFSTPSQRKYVQDPKLQKLRISVKLPMLMERQEGDLPHPNHDFAWDTTNVMCRGVHRRNLSPHASFMTTSTTSTDEPDASPLERLSKHPKPALTPSTSRRISSNGIILHTRGKSCFQCGSTCCYFAEQAKLAQLGSARDKEAQKLALRARQRCEMIEQKYPGGIEEYDAHLACSECSRVFCFKHGSMCKDLLCRHALCADCDKMYAGRCVEHRE